jgi:hypothetical protein
MDLNVSLFYRSNIINCNNKKFLSNLNNEKMIYFLDLIFISNFQWKIYYFMSSSLSSYIN